MAARYDFREVRIFALCNDAVNGTHFAIVRGGRWGEVLRHLNLRAATCGIPGNLFIEGADGKLRPLMA